jgi:uncharacterized coiled-coil protein SlyX
MRSNPLEKVIAELEAERAVLDKVIAKLRDQLATARTRKRGSKLRPITGQASGDAV